MGVIIREYNSALAPRTAMSVSASVQVRMSALRWMGRGSATESGSPDPAINIFSTAPAP
jgi:hypothetical protein